MEITKKRLRELVNTGRWDELGRLFSFEPKYTHLNGQQYFNWLSAPKELMQALSPRRFTEFDPFKAQRDPRPNTRRVTLFVKQNGRCYYCERETSLDKFTVDHLLPRSRGEDRARGYYVRGSDA